MSIIALLRLLLRLRVVHHPGLLQEYLTSITSLHLGQVGSAALLFGLDLGLAVLNSKP